LIYFVSGVSSFAAINCVYNLPNISFLLTLLCCFIEGAEIDVFITLGRFSDRDVNRMSYSE